MSHNILLIQDDPADARAVCEALTGSSDGSFQVECVRCCSAGLERQATDGKQLTDGKQDCGKVETARSHSARLGYGTLVAGLGGGDP